MLFLLNCQQAKNKLIEIIEVSEISELRKTSVSSFSYFWIKDCKDWNCDLFYDSVKQWLEEKTQDWNKFSVQVR